MDRQEQFLKYLDKELSPIERMEVDALMESDPRAREQMEAIRTLREQLFTALEGLNPVDDVEVPAFKKPGSSGIFTLQLLRYAASIALLAGLAVSFMVLVSRQGGDRDAQVTSPAIADVVQEDALDCYISPNRCWNKRQLPLIIIEIK